MDSENSNSEYLFLLIPSLHFVCIPAIAILAYSDFITKYQLRLAGGIYLIIIGTLWAIYYFNLSKTNKEPTVRQLMVSMLIFYCGLGIGIIINSTVIVLVVIAIRIFLFLILLFRNYARKSKSSNGSLVN